MFVNNKILVFKTIILSLLVFYGIAAEAVVPRVVYYTGYPYTEELSRKFYTIDGYCNAYSAWRNGNPADEFSFTVERVIDVDGDNIQCWGSLTQKRTGYTQITYIPTTAYHDCPMNSSNYYGNDCDCDFGFIEMGGQCKPQTKKNEPTCSAAGNNTPHPILLGTGEKYLQEDDFIDSEKHPLSFQRNYLHRRSDNFSQMGGGWTHNYMDRLEYQPSKATSPTDPAADEQVTVHMGDGGTHWFIFMNGVWTSKNSADTLVQNSQGWLLQSDKDDITRQFDTTGKVLKLTRRNGWTYQYIYNASNQLQTVTNQFGRSLQFIYNNLNQLVGIDINGVVQVGYEYDVAKRLQTVRFLDGAKKSYLYENSIFPLAITGIIDENSRRFETFVYDSYGLAVKTVRAGNVAPYEVSYPSTPFGFVSVKDPLGTDRSYSYSRNHGTLAVVSSNVPTGEDQNDAANRTQNSSGLIDAETDFRGFSNSYSWDLNRHLLVSSVEAVGQPESRTTSTEWHPQWHLPTRITEQGRTTDTTYDERGNRLSETIADTTGAARTTSWTYNAQSLVATETAPNGATTSYQYDSVGNLTQSANALGHTHRYTHDAAGRILSHTAPNGLLSTYTYDPRGRMLSANAGGLLSVYTYTPSGQLASLQLPHGHSISYQYDAAQRLVGWSDNRGAHASYRLDPMGNRVREEIRNAQGQQVWLLVRSINSLNRVESTSQAGQTTRYSYDANGDLASTTNGAGETTSYGLDALRRVQTLSNAEGATASLSYNALDAVTQASDYKGVATQYARDALGNATQETSADTGQQSTQYDALGLPSAVTDALGRLTTYERDLLGRPTRITHPDGTPTTLRYDQAGAGHLSEIEDASGSTSYERDSHGRVTRKTQILANGHTRSVAYQYAANGLLAAITYPDARTLQYQYDATGQITGLTWAGQPIVQGITWNPLGQPTGWSWNLPGAVAAIPATRSYNSAGQLTATELGSYQYDAAGRIVTLKQKLWRPANPNPQASTISQATITWNASYDRAGRLASLSKTTAAGAPPDTTAFQYDTNGNLLGSQRERAGTSTTRSYSTEAGHNKLLGFEQTSTSSTGSASASVNYQYDSAGSLQTDGLHRYSYDSQGRLQSASTGQGPDAPTTKYAHNALGQRVFKTEALYSTSSGLLEDDEEDLGFLQSIQQFFTRLWSPKASDAEHLGWAYLYDEEGSLLGEYGMGGANSGGQGQYFYLPTASGLMPIAAEIDGRIYAIHADHLNTPRRLTQPDGQTAWQWAYSAYGDEAPTLGAKRFTDETTTPSTGATSIPPVRFNLRYPGQTFDEETGLHYNYFRSYDPKTGRYTQGDPIGLEGGWNRFGYVGGDPINWSDPEGLAAEHTSGARPSTQGKHEKGQARKGRDAGGEKGDKSRRPPSQKPPSYKGPWPPIRGILPLVCPLCEVMEPPPLPVPELC